MNVIFIKYLYQACRSSTCHTIKDEKWLLFQRGSFDLNSMIAIIKPENYFKKSNNIGQPYLVCPSIGDIGDGHYFSTEHSIQLNWFLGLIINPACQLFFTYALVIKLEQHGVSHPKL